VPKGVRVQVPPSPCYLTLFKHEGGIYEGYPTLKIETNYLEDHQAHLKVEFDAEQLNEAKQRAARKIARQTKIPGFRPGKAPYGIVLRTVGESSILEEAMEILIDAQYPKILEESKIKPYGPGQLENVVSFDPPIFEFKVPLDAEVTLADYQAIRIPYELPPVLDSDVDRVLEDLRDRQAVLEVVDRPAQPGDQVFIRLSGTRLDPEEGESSVLVTDRPMPVTIPSDETGQTSEWPFPGFSHSLIDLSASEQKTIAHTFHEDADYVSLRGKSAEFSITVESVKSRTLPELNDEFAHTVGEYETIDALRADIRTSLETEQKEDYEEGYNDKIAEELFKLTNWKYPPQMLDHEIELFLDQLENRLAQQNMDMATYLKIRQLDEAGLKEEIKPMAEQRMKRTLILMEIARQQDIQVNEQELETESMRTMDRLSHMMPPDKARKTITDEFVRNMIGNIGADLLIKHTWEYLHSITRGEPTGSTNPEPVVETSSKKRSKKKEIKE
jgi:trigger factor